MVIKNKFFIGQIVYLKTDKEQYKRIVRGIEVYSEGELMYILICGTSISSHHAMEITSEEDVLEKLK